VAFFVARLLNTSESTWHVDAEFVRYDAASEQQNLEDTWLSPAENWWIVSTWDFDLSKQEDIHPMPMGIAV
jgi:hypothetical protein